MIRKKIKYVIFKKDIYSNIFINKLFNYKDFPAGILQNPFYDPALPKYVLSITKHIKRI